MGAAGMAAARAAPWEAVAVACSEQQCSCSRPPLHLCTRLGISEQGKSHPFLQGCAVLRWMSRSPAVSCELCRGKLQLQQCNCKESSAAGLRGLVSEREKQGLAHPYLTFV